MTYLQSITSFVLQQPSTIIAQRKFSPAKDPCSVLWDVLWGDLVTMEFSHGKKDHPKSPPSRLILYLQARPSEVKEHVYVVKCSRGTDQALRVYSSIERAMNTYGQNQSKVCFVLEPYLIMPIFIHKFHWCETTRGSYHPSLWSGSTAFSLRFWYLIHTLSFIIPKL